MVKHAKREAAAMPEGLRRLETEEDLGRRIEELRRCYEPYTRNLVPPLQKRGFGPPLNPWEFRYTRGGSSARREWREIQLPEWKGQTSWEGEYRLRFRVPEELREHPRLLLHFGGVETTVAASLNGRKIGEHAGGSDPFSFDLSAVIDRKGENLLQLSVVNGLCVNGIGHARAFSPEPFRKTGETYKLVGEWGNMNGREGRAGGIWRGVKLVGTADTWIEGVLIEPDPDNSRVGLRVQIGSKRKIDGLLRIDVLPRNFEGGAAVFEEELDGGERVAVIPIPGQRWWSPAEPYLYTARLTILAGGTVADVRDFTFGQRSFRYDEGIRRYRLNGKPHRFRGTSTINSLNMAFLRGDEANLVDQILLAKAAGFTMFRHHIMSPIEEVDEYLDMYGMLSQPEMPIWGRFHPELTATAVDQLPRILRQHYNHPSTALFAISSESAYYREAYAAYQKKAIEIIERDFPLIEWKIEGARGNLSGVPGRRHPEGDLYEYKDRLYDAHEYPGWYVNLGSLEPVRDGETLMTVGEFGPESLSNLSTMQACWPEGAYPADPDAVVARDELPFGVQYGWAESRWFLPTPRTLRGWIEATQSHSAFVHRYQTTLFRRSPSVLGYHQYFLNEPVWNTWRKTICGADLSPKRPYFAMARANDPVLLDLFRDREHFLPAEAVSARVYLANDGDEDIRDAEMVFFLVRPDGKVLREGGRRVSAKMAEPIEVGEVELKASQMEAPGPYTVRVFLMHDGKTLAEAEWAFQVLDPAVWPADRPNLRGCRTLHFGGSEASLAAGRHLMEEMGGGYRCLPLPAMSHPRQVAEGDLVILDGVADWNKVPVDILKGHLEGGGRILLAELEPGSLDWLLPALEVAADPVKALFRPDLNHPVFHAGNEERLTAEDFRLWNYVPVKHPLFTGPVQPYAAHRTRDLVDCPVRFDGKEFDRVVHISRDDRIRLFSIADADRSASALLEIRWGRGLLLISQARLFERYFDHPLARILFHKLIGYLANGEEETDVVSREKFDVIQRF